MVKPFIGISRSIQSRTKLTHSLPIHRSQIAMSIFQRDPRAGAFLGGDRVSGQDIRDQNGALSVAISSRDLNFTRNL
jgi:hypothetical protein